MFKQSLNMSAPVAAKLLLGAHLSRTVSGRQIVVKIVETEAYDASDAASHSSRGQTPRTAVMFGPAGFLYVYFTYGMHYCCNIVTGASGEGSAVLIRAVEPMSGQQYMLKSRYPQTGVNVCNGPAKLCQALQINKNLNGHNLESDPVKLYLKSPLKDSEIITTTRIGISKAKDTPWRFYIAGNPYVSKL